VSFRTGHPHTIPLPAAASLLPLLPPYPPVQFVCLSVFKVVAVELSPSGDVYTIQLLPSGNGSPWVLEVSSSDGKTRKLQ
jgi:hypothetical protein